MLVLACLLLTLIFESKCSLDSKVVNSEFGSITRFAHSAFLVVHEARSAYVCGSSILNQRVLLTAAHCIDTCGVKECEKAFIYAGNAQKRRGIKIRVVAARRHERYRTYRLNNDIGLVLLETNLPLSNYIKRITLMKRPPLEKIGVLAGWGLIDEQQNTGTDNLRFAEQRIWPRRECLRRITSLPQGTLCAGDILNQKYASEGDSGSALLVNNHIQVGLVSYKRPDVSAAVVVYTDVAYFYNWIKKTSKKMYCDNKKT